jgi:ABC-2 type transport system ATP-binding protein
MSAVVLVDDLVKVYPGRRKTPPVEAVRGISFAVEPGEFFGLLGPNGAGKSTTLGCITTLVRPTRGRVLVDGLDVVRRPGAAKRQIAVVPQTRNLDRDLTVREVLTFHGAYFGLPRSEREARADRLLAQMQLTDRAAVKPLTLSGGLQQRLLIARALMHDPKVLLLDEPTIGLDPQARRLLWDTLQGLHRQGRTVIMTTHYMEEADRLCQRLAVIDHGRILTLDTPAALKQMLPGGRSSTCGCVPRGRWRRACRRCPACRAWRRWRATATRRSSSACVCSWTRPTVCSTACSAPCGRAARTCAT